MSMTYEILEAEDSDALVEVVNAAMAEGWRPVGGVAILRYKCRNERENYTESESVWAQAMVRDELLRPAAPPDSRRAT